jgi:FHS family glucose/mannose:H+ symporter-like MFS transporter
MKKGTAGSSWIWLTTMVFAGAGCNFIGPFLPSISATWRLHDRQAGLLLACLFFGSFLGTMLLGNNLARTLRIGAFGSSIGLLLLATMANQAAGFAGGIVGLTIMGFGLGQLMSSINLIVGASSIWERSRHLANIGIAWCVGAMLSPVLTTVLIPHLSPGARLGIFAPTYLLPMVLSNKLGIPKFATEPIRSFEVQVMGNRWRPALSWILVFLVYGGIEASIGGWISSFAVRYHMEDIGMAQWMMSLFWSGLIIGRLITAKLVTPSREVMIVRAAILSSVCSLSYLVMTHSPVALSVGVAITGVCLSPLFPLLLSMTIECKLSSRLMGGILAASGLGAALLPSLLGIISSVSSLRAAMLVPLLGLISLAFLCWRHRFTPQIVRLL